MTIHLFQDKGTALGRQRLSWKDMVGKPISKLDDDAFTRVRAILMNGVELDALRTKQVLLRMNADARVEIAQLMRVEQHQATTINWLIGADHSPLETTIGYEQTAIEVTASVAQLEPDSYLAQGYRYALLEDFDHLYRYSALLDRLEGKDANNITQGYTDIVPSRPTWVHHRAPEHDLLEPYGPDATLATKLHALTLTGGEYQTHDYYMNIGPIFADPVARQLYAEIASVESQHITHYGSMLNPRETPLEKLLIAEACEVWNYAGCVEQESNPRVRAIWEWRRDSGWIPAATSSSRSTVRRTSTSRSDSPCCSKRWRNSPRPGRSSFRCTRGRARASRAVPWRSTSGGSSSSNPWATPRWSACWMPPPSP